MGLRPADDAELHEFVLQTGRTAAIGDKQQHHTFAAEGVRVQQEVTHGNAFGIYFFDPEDNRNEVCLRIGRAVRQPFRRTIDFGVAPDAIWAEAERLLTDGGDAYQPAS